MFEPIFSPDILKIITSKHTCPVCQEILTPEPNYPAPFLTHSDCPVDFRVIPTHATHPDGQFFYFKILMTVPIGEDNYELWIENDLMRIRTCKDLYLLPFDHNALLTKIPTLPWSRSILQDRIRLILTFQ